MPIPLSDGPSNPKWMAKGLMKGQGLISQAVVRRRIAKCRKPSGVYRQDYADQGMLQASAMDDQTRKKWLGPRGLKGLSRPHERKEALDVAMNPSVPEIVEAKIARRLSVNA